VEACGCCRAVNIPSENIRIVCHPRNVDAAADLRRAGVHDLPAVDQRGTGIVGLRLQLGLSVRRHEVISVRRQDPHVVLDRSRLFNSDQSELTATMRGDLIAPNPTAIVRLTGLLP
jgi:hypothetical protein